MKKFYILLLCMVFAIPGFTQSRFFIGLSGGLDFYSNKYYTPNNYEKFEDGKTDFNAGLDLGYRFSDVTRFRLEFRYSEYSFGQRSGTLESEMSLFNLDVNPRLDIRVWSLKKLELFLSPGFRLEYVLDSDEETVWTNGTTSSTNYVDKDYNDKIQGFIGGAILKYNFTKHLGVTLSPDYTLFFDKLYDRNDGSLQRFNINVGIEWRI
jgi:hypothetical protein